MASRAIRRSCWITATAAFLANAGLAVPPPTSEVVYVRKVCSSPTFFDPTHCVQTMAEVNSWIPTRFPIHNPVLIDVGPGDWGPFSCGAQNGITVRGAGRDVTRLIKTGAGGTAMVISNCFDLTVESLTAMGSSSGVTFGAQGSSTWSNTDLVGGGGPGNQTFALGWYDQGDCGNPPIHYFFGSRIVALGSAFFNYGFLARCAEHWFFGGEVLTTNEVDRTPIYQTSVFADTGSEIHFFGTTIRSLVGAAVTNLIFGPEFGTPGGIHGVYVKGTGNFHSHGAIVSVNGSASDLAQSVTGVRLVGSDGFVHTHETAFVVDAGSGGTSTRLAGEASKIQSPFLWHQGPEPPRAVPGDPSSAFTSSIQGADVFVETDCAPDGSCSAGTQQHLMTYDANCSSSGPWFNTVTGECREVLVRGTAPSSAQSFVETDCTCRGNCNAGGSETHLMIRNASCSTDGPWYDATTGRCRGTLLLVTDDCQN